MKQLLLVSSNLIVEMRAIHSANWERRHGIFRRGAGPGLGFVLGIVAEWQRAIAATHRYQELKRMAPERGSLPADAARRIYTEFYSSR